MLVEALTGDFRGDRQQIATVLSGGPDVFAHNIETVERLPTRVRDQRCDYAQTLAVLATAKEIQPDVVTKSSIMLGLGERHDEIVAAMRALRRHDVDFLTLGQYLQPTPAHLPVQEYVDPAAFDAHRRQGEALGFRYVASGPLVRSSYRAGELFIRASIESRKADANG